MTKDKNSIFIKNIYYMLSYAFSALHKSNYEDIAVEEFENIQNLFAAILAKGVGHQLKQGLYREYINCTEEIPVMRGKIDITGTIKNQLEKRKTLTCNYDELSEDNLLNQTIKSTVLLLLRNAKVDDFYKSDLKKKMLYFSNVREIDLTAVRWNTIRFHRNNHNYRILVSICQLIVQGMLLTTDSGELKLATFIDEQRMCRLYEKFLLEYYKAEYPMLSVKSPQIDWAVDDGIRTMLPVMQTDVVLSYGSKILIMDAKYYSKTTQTQYDTPTLHSNNLYQIFAYVKNEEFKYRQRDHEVSGMLLYAKTEEQIQPDNVYLMSGNKISVRTLDLNQDFKGITVDLHRIVKDHFGNVADSVISV